MAIQHIRRPYRLDDDDYGEFCTILAEYLGDDRSLPNRPTQLVAQQSAQGTAFNTILDAYNSAKNTRDVASQNVTNAMKAMVEKLRWMQIILPTLTPGNEEILVQFGLDAPIPTSYAEVKNYADAVDVHWQTVR